MPPYLLHARWKEGGWVSGAVFHALMSSFRFVSFRAFPIVLLLIIFRGYISMGPFLFLYYSHYVPFGSPGYLHPEGH